MLCINKFIPEESIYQKFRPFYDSDVIKVITGIRRCGKSFIIKGIINELLSRGVKEKEREYRPFREIKDGYPRYIISLDRFRDQQEGVKHINAIDLFLGKEQIGE